MTPTGRRAWRTASYSGNGENCVEVAPVAEGVVIRHSKHPDAGTITFSHDAWTAFVRDVLDERPTSVNGVVVSTKSGTDMLVRSLSTDIELRFDAGEWSAFRAGAADGEFDFTSRLTTA